MTEPSVKRGSRTDQDDLTVVTNTECRHETVIGDGGYGNTIQCEDCGYTFPEVPW